MKKRIGIITYHAAHNYGSVLQAYALQQKIEQLGHQVEIINFRPKSQKNRYSLYRIPIGVKILGFGSLRNILKADLGFLPYHFERKRKFDRFELFLSERLHLTKEYSTGRQLEMANMNYDLLLSGSDQIWNKHTAEIIFSKEDISKCYFLAFGKAKRKAAFASSIGNMKDYELEGMIEFLKNFDYIATREKTGAKMLSEILEQKVDIVLDPTFLLSKDDWMNNLDSPPICLEKYILLYSLSNDDGVKLWVQYMKIISKKNGGLKLIAITPNATIKEKGVTFVWDAGPKEFINYYSNAELVLADSFHGAVFSVIFRKPFWLLGNKYNKHDIRKIDLLEQFGLLDRIITDQGDILQKDVFNLEYSKYEDKINVCVKESEKCLIKAIGAEE